MTTPEQGTGSTATATVGLVGGTGRLGGLIGHALLDQPGVLLRVLVRPGSVDGSRSLSERGADVVVGDLDAGGSGALAELCDGAAAVVSAVQGGPDVLIDGQGRLLAAARQARVGRFIPSDYSVDFFGLEEGENVNSDWRRAFALAAEVDRGEVEVVHILNGCFLDRDVLFGFLGAIDLESSEAHLWGGGEEAMDFTTYADTARYVAAAALDARPLPSRFGVAGDVQDFHGLVRAYESAAGRPLHVRRHGTLADLDARIAGLQATHPTDLYSYLPLMYWRAMLSGKGKSATLVNDRYPDIRTTTVEQYVEAEAL